MASVGDSKKEDNTEMQAQVQVMVTTYGSWVDHQFASEYSNDTYGMSEHGHNGGYGTYFTNADTWYRVAANAELLKLFETKGQEISYRLSSGKKPHDEDPWFVVSIVSEGRTLVDCAAKKADSQPCK